MSCDHGSFLHSSWRQRVQPGCAVQVFMLSGDAVLNVDTLSELLGSGHSRVPVHMPGNRYAATVYQDCGSIYLHSYV